MSLMNGITNFSLAVDVSVTRANAIENVNFKTNSELSSNGISSGSPPLSSTKLNGRDNERHSHEQQTPGKNPCLGSTSSGAPTTSVSCVSSSSDPADLVPSCGSIQNASTKVKEHSGVHCCRCMIKILSCSMYSRLYKLIFSVGLW